MPEEKKPYIVDGQRVTLEEYRKTKYEDLRVRVPKGRKEEIKAFVATTGKSLNSFINEAIDEKIEREKKSYCMVPIKITKIWVPILYIIPT